MCFKFFQQSHLKRRNKQVKLILIYQPNISQILFQQVVNIELRIFLYKVFEIWCVFHTHYMSQFRPNLHFKQPHVASDYPTGHCSSKHRLLSFSPSPLSLWNCNENSLLCEFLACIVSTSHHMVSLHYLPCDAFALSHNANLQILLRTDCLNLKIESNFNKTIT